MGRGRRKGGTAPAPTSREPRRYRALVIASVPCAPPQPIWADEDVHCGPRGRAAAFFPVSLVERFQTFALNPVSSRSLPKRGEHFPQPSYDSRYCRDISTRLGPQVMLRLEHAPPIDYCKI